MAIDEVDQPESGQIDGEEPTSVQKGGEESLARVGRYTWADFMEEFGYAEDVSSLYPDGKPQRGAEDLGLSADDEAEPFVPAGSDWERTSFDPESYLGFHPDDLEERITDHAAANAKYYYETFREYVDPATTPVVKDVWTWEHFKWDYYYDENGDRPRSGDDIVEFDPTEYLSFDPEHTEATISQAGDVAKKLDDLIDDRTVNVNQDLDEDEFFSTAEGHTTLVNRYDLEKAVPFRKKTHFQEEERYWVNKPYAFVVLFHSRKENEKKYYLIEPHLNEIEEDLKEFLTGKLRTAIKYADENVATGGSEDERKKVIERETKKLLKRYDLFEQKGKSGDSESGFLQNVLEIINQDESNETDEDEGKLDGISARPEPIVLEEDPERLSEYQIEKLLYLLKRDFIGYEQIDGIKHDINVEDISCDGYNSPVFVYHTDYEQIISNVYHGENELDDFVVKLAQRSGKGISKRRPQVDATLPDGSRAQLTLGREVSDHGTNYTIRQFKDVPFTPIDLINWNTFSLEEMAFLWLCIENHKSLIFAGGTASGKTTSLNAVSLFIPSNTKIVSIEDTREVELPQRNWVASVTRPSFSDDDQGDVDEFDLLEAALRQRPDYIVMGEIRGEEGRTLFQVMSTGHTTYTTFHADSVGEVLKRFTTDPINVSKTMFTALDLVSIQTQTRVQGRKVRRNKKLTEVNHYDADTDEINVQDVYQWQAETDEFLKMGDSNTLAEIKFDRGWSQERLENEIFKREVILAYLIKNGLNEYTKVAATIQAFINDPDTILTLIANGQLEESLEDLREMESVKIQVDPAKEELVPRPDPDEKGYNLAMDILEQAEEKLFEDYRGETAASLKNAIGGMSQAEAEFTTDSAATDDFEFGGDVDEEFADEEFEFGDEDAFTVSEEGSFEAAGDATTGADSGTDDDASADIEDLWEETDTPALEERDDEDDDIEHPALEAGDSDGSHETTAEQDDTSELPEESTESALEGDDPSPPPLDGADSDVDESTEPHEGAEASSGESDDTEPETSDDDPMTSERPSESTVDPPSEPVDDETGDDTPRTEVASDQSSLQEDQESGGSRATDQGEPIFGQDGEEAENEASTAEDGETSAVSEERPFEGGRGSDEIDGQIGDDESDEIFADSSQAEDDPTRDSVASDDPEPFGSGADSADDSEPFGSGADSADDSEPFGSGADDVDPFDDERTFDTDSDDGGGVFGDETDEGSEDTGETGFDAGDDLFGGEDDDDSDISGFEDVSFEFDDEDDGEEGDES